MEYSRKIFRVCFITSEYITEPVFTGGLGNYLGRITLALAKKGYDIHVIIRSDKDESFVFNDVKVHRVKINWGLHRVFDKLDGLIPSQYMPAYFDVKGAWRVWRKWVALSQGLDFDLVQIPNCQSVGLFFQFERVVPVVARISNFRRECDLLSLPNVTNGNRLRWMMEEQCIRASKHRFTSSQFLAQQIGDFLKLKSIDVIEPPFFLETRKTDVSVLPEHFSVTKYGLFFGTMSRLKGVHLLAETLPIVSKRLPNFHMLFVGNDGIYDNGQSMRNYVKECAGDYGSRIEILNPLKHDQLYPIIQQAQFVVLPSLHDNLPNACLEAMGMGKIVIATKGTCFEQLIVNGKSGILVSPDKNALADGMIQAWNLSSDKRVQMEENARARIELLSPEHAIANHLNYYESIVQGEVAGAL